MLGLSPGPAIDDDRRYAAILLSQVLGAPDNSRLHWALLETGLAEEAQAGYDPHDAPVISTSTPRATQTGPRRSGPRS